MADIEPPDHDQQQVQAIPTAPARAAPGPSAEDQRKLAEADRRQEQRRQRVRPFVRAGMVIVRPTTPIPMAVP
jgi:hypothetical protein